MEGLSTTKAPVIPDRLYFRIRDVADIIGVKPYVLRYWETEFPTILSPDKSKTGQRVYKRAHIESLLMIKQLLYGERYSIEGARKRIREMKKEGELKSFKTTSVANQIPSEGPEARAERVKKIKATARELKRLVNSPIREIFKY
jgi:DNA-binding transcriptional MerR regulator